MMRILAAILVFAVNLSAQTIIRVAPEDAANHLLKNVVPKYPPLAQTANIQGNVILNITIDETGSTSNIRWVRGHPMLSPAAIEAVKQWKYQPFEVDGKPASVSTIVMVRFGNPKNHDAEDRAEVLFQDRFWRVEEAAKSAVRARAFATAEQRLSEAGQVLDAAAGQHGSERWHWLLTSGEALQAQQKYAEAEERYRKALALNADEKRSPQNAFSLSHLASLYGEQKKYDLARETLLKALPIYQANFEHAGNTPAEQVYGQAIAYASWDLSKWAFQSNDSVNGAKYCRTVVEFERFLLATDHDSFVSACQVPR